MQGLRSLFLLVAILGACTGSASAAGSVASRPWNVTESTDRLTDVEILKASRRYSAPPFLVDVTIRCQVGQSWYYFTTYKANGSPAPYYLKMMSTGSVPFTVATTRIGNGKAQTSILTIGKYRNEVVFGSSNSLGASTDELIKAKKFLVKLELTTGEALLDIDQSGSEISSMLSNCVHKHDEVLRKSKEQELSTHALYEKEDAENAKYEKRNWPSAVFYGHGNCSAEYDGLKSATSNCSIQMTSKRMDTSDVVYASGPLDDVSFNLRIVGGQAYGTFTDPRSTTDRRTPLLNKVGSCWEGKGMRFCVDPDHMVAL